MFPTLTTSVCVTDLSTLPPSDPREYVFADGYSSTGDGGANVFFWDSAYVGLGNGGTTIVPSYPGYTTGAWRMDVPSDFFNVKWFGAKGDNVTDDFPAIQKLIDLCNAAVDTNSIVTVYFPPGIYLCSQPPRITGGWIRLRGASWNEQGSNPTSCIGFFENVSAPGIIVQGSSGLHPVTTEVTSNGYADVWCVVMQDSWDPYAVEPEIIYSFSSECSYLGGLGSYTLEFFFMSPNSVSTDEYVFSNVFAIAGCARTDLSTNPADPGYRITTLYVIFGSETDGNTYFYCGITTSNNPTPTSPFGAAVNIQSAPITTGVLHFVALDYDGERLALFVDGQPSGAPAPCSGTIVQETYETFSTGTFYNYGWPTPNGQVGHVDAQYPFMLGSVRQSAVSRYSGSFTPPSTEFSYAADVDNRTMLLLNFDPQNLRADYWYVGRSYYYQGPHDLWIQVRGAMGAQYLPGVEIENLSIQSQQDSVYAWCMIDSQVIRCSGNGDRGVTLDFYSYESEVRDCLFFSDSVVPSYSWAVGTLNGGFFPAVAGVSSEGYAWPFVTTNGGSFSHIYSTTGYVGFLYASGGTLVMTEVYGYDGALSLSSTPPLYLTGIDAVEIHGGAIATPVDDGVAVVLMDRVGPSSFGGILDPLNPNGFVFSFIGTDLGNAVRVNSASYSPSITWVDPSKRFGRLVIEGQDPVGLNTVDASAIPLATHAMSGNDFLWGGIKVTDVASVLTGPTVITLPTVLSGYRRWWTNKTAIDLTLQGPTGTGFTIGPGKSMQGQSDGTNWVRLSPDTASP